MKSEANKLEAESKVRVHKVPLDFPCDQRFVSKDQIAVTFWSHGIFTKITNIYYI